MHRTEPAPAAALFPSLGHGAALDALRACPGAIAFILHFAVAFVVPRAPALVFAINNSVLGMVPAYPKSMALLPAYRFA